MSVEDEQTRPDEATPIAPSQGEPWRPAPESATEPGAGSVETVAAAATEPVAATEEVQAATEAAQEPDATAEPAVIAPATASVSARVPVPVEAKPKAPAPAPAAATAPAPKELKWYVVQVYSGYEQKVKLSLFERIKQERMEPYFGEILIPTETVQDVQGRRRVASRTFYPGYIFVQMALTDHVWHVVRDTPKVTGFVGGREPQPVPAPEIASVVQQVEEGAAKPRPRVVFTTGDHVRVNDGAFANFTGTVEQVNPDKQKVRVLVSIFGRATPVELDYTQVEKTA